MCHAEGVCSRGLFSVRWDDRVWEANLAVSDVTPVPPPDRVVDRVAVVASAADAIPARAR